MRKIFVFALLLTSGAVANLLVRPPPAGSSQAAPARPVEQANMDRTFPRGSEPAHAALASPAGASSSPRSNPRRPAGAERPKGDGATAVKKLEERILDLLQSPVSQLVQVSRTVNADGSVDLIGKDEAGNNAFQRYSVDGQLAMDGWTDSSGETLFRGFYESGAIKVMSWKRPDQSSTSIHLTTSGTYESRFDRMPDGSSISTAYDDAGRVRDMWRHGQDGKHVTVSGL